MNAINQERFEAWLFSQPNDRVFNYAEGISTYPVGCLVCNYLRENTRMEYFGVGACDSGYVDLGSGDFQYVPFGPWLTKLLKSRKSEIFTAGETKEIYISLYGNPELAALETIAREEQAT